VLIPTSSTPPSTTPCELWLDAGVLHQMTTKSSYPHRHPTGWALSQWSHTVSSTPCHQAWTSAPISAHPSIECTCTAPQIETPICTCHITSHQFIWQHTCGVVGGPPPHRCWTFPIPLVQIGYGHLCVLWVWRRRTNCRPCCPPMSNPSISDGLTVLDDETTEWLLNICPEI